MAQVVYEDEYEYEYEWDSLQLSIGVASRYLPAFGGRRGGEQREYLQG
jgi:hypothetical protein